MIINFCNYISPITLNKLIHTVRTVHVNNNFSIVSLFFKKWNVNFSQPISKKEKTLQIGHEYIYFFKMTNDNFQSDSTRGYGVKGRG